MSWTAAAKIVGNTALLAELQSGSGSAGFKVYDSSDTLLAFLAIDATTSSVNGTTGVLTLVPGDPEDSAPASGTAAKADLVSESDVVLYSALPVVQGTTGVAGYLVLSATSIISGSQVVLVSASIG